MRFGDRIDPDRIAGSGAPRCASVGGLSLHADVAVPARDRSRLERLCRYVARPPVATERLSWLPDGRILYELRHRWRDGTTHVAFLPLEFLEKLAALVSAPRVNLVRYHGILAPAARHRAAVIPTNGTVPEEDLGAGRERSASSVTDGAPPGSRPQPRPRNYTWAELMQRVFEIDVLECPDCQGRMRILAAIHSPEAIRAILECLGLPPRPPPIRSADADAFLEDPSAAF